MGHLRQSNLKMLASVYTINRKCNVHVNGTSYTTKSYNPKIIWERYWVMKLKTCNTLSKLQGTQNMSNNEYCHREFIFLQVPSPPFPILQATVFHADVWVCPNLALT